MPTTDGPLTNWLALGALLGMGPIEARVGLELTAVEPPHRMVFRSFSGPIRWEHEYRLTRAAVKDQT
jgi:hypothetical protein